MGFKQVRTVFCLVGFMAVQGCHKDDEQIIKEVISGYVQKGPFLNGTTLSIAELNSDLSPTGRTFSTQVSSNDGSFVIQNITLNSPYIECRADGFYFNEVDGNSSLAPLTLWGLSDISVKNAINVNVLTHLEKDRVKFLVAHGTGFSEAKMQASKEVQGIFGFTRAIPSTELLDLSKEGEDNAVLLAVSVITQGYRSVADVSEMLSNISFDIKEDGILDNTSIKSILANNAKALRFKLLRVRRNIENKYKALGLVITISDFESYVNSYIEFSKSFQDYSPIPEPQLGEVTDIDNNVYKTVLIKDQWWMQENLRTTHYANGEAMINGTQIANLAGNDSTKYYFNTPYPPPTSDQVTDYGRYYTLAAAMNGEVLSYSVPSGVQGVCPNGWHLPSTGEYLVFLDYLISFGYDGIIQSDPFGFNFQYGGVRGFDSGSYYVPEYDWGYRTSDGAYGYGSAASGINVRCVKN